MLTDAFASAIPSGFFAQNPVKVARALLGTHLVRRVMDEDWRTVAVLRIVETEAYDCPVDPSCYVINRIPGAKEALSGEPGRFYFHTAYERPLLNVICGPVGYEATILIRAAEVLTGLEWLRQNRPVNKDVELTNGPAKLVQALNIKHLEGKLVNHLEFFLAPGSPVPDEAVENTPRIGLYRGAELEWRWLERGNPWVSPAKPKNKPSPISR